MSDRVAAATACSECRDAHVQKYAKDDTPVKVPRPADATGICDDDPLNPEGRE